MVTVMGAAFNSNSAREVSGGWQAPGDPRQGKGGGGGG